MSRFRELVESSENSVFVLQGNEAFALGVVHAGYHAATGYAGTPSTEVIDKALQFVQDKMVVGWAVNEAVAVGNAVGHAIAGDDVVVTMKIPGVFQAGDTITTSAFYTAPAGALVIYAATDYVPSSTQHIIDSRYFFASSRLPILEPRDHQEMYDIAGKAADMSRRFNTPVVVLVSGILAHSEGLVTTKAARKVTPRELPENLHNWMLMPAIARKNYDTATQIRIPAIAQWSENGDLFTEEIGSENWGIIVCGESYGIVKEALSLSNHTPSIFSLAITNPVPENRIRDFANKISGTLFIIEDGDTFLEEKVKLLGVSCIGKEKYSVITDWTPDMVLEHFAKHIDIPLKVRPAEHRIQQLNRPPSICPGCPYSPFASAVSTLKKKKKLYAVFGDIGCSTLLHFLNALDTVNCMGASDSMRQGFVLSRPDMAHKTISVIGDSCECHSGMDSTRNAIFRNIPGVKIILDNTITAMTGGQPSPSSPTNLAGHSHGFSLKRAVEAEGGRTVVVDSYNVLAVEKALVEALDLAEQGVFTTMICEGACVKEVDPQKKVHTLKFDYHLCIKCGRCDICPGIVFDKHRKPSFTSLCTSCGGNLPHCQQKCPVQAIIPKISQAETPIALPKYEKLEEICIPSESFELPESLRIAIRGIGGQGSLFFGKVLSEIALQTPYSEKQIIKGDTHGMAQLGGPVISSFACGTVYSSVFTAGTVDVLIVMEISQILQPGFIELLKPGGKIIINQFKALPHCAKIEDYPDIDAIDRLISPYHVIRINANKLVHDLGDFAGKSANAAVLGLLSKVNPLNSIPVDIWRSSLMKMSSSPRIQSANISAFEAGREMPLQCEANLLENSEN